MPYQAMYRRWRPTTFEQVVGQTATVKTLRHQIETGRIAHAYLFCGCHGTGKTTLAKLMSRAINCQNPDHGDPCGECEACRAIMSESTMDVLELDAASNNSVDNIRDLLEQVRYPAQVGKYKVYIIDEVHMLSTAAFNALLKTLEEPPAHVVFILATTEPQKLPATILSRVQRYDFGRIPANLMVERMRLALTDMHITAEDEALRMVARAAEGAMRDAFSILDMCVAGAENDTITAAQVRDVLGTSDREFVFGFADCLSRRDTSGVMRLTDELMRSGREPQVFLRELSGHVRALLTVKAVETDAASILEVTEEDERRYREQANGFSNARLLRMLDLFMHAESELRYASAPRVGLEAAVLRACEKPADEDASALLERIGELEQKLGKLESDIESGRLAPAPAAEGKPARGAAGRKPAENGAPSANGQEEAASPATSAPAKPKPALSDDGAVWDATLKAISKSDPPIFMMLRKGKFIGAVNGVYRLQFPANNSFDFVKLGQPARKEMIAKAISEVTGAPAMFEPVKETSAGDKRLDSLRDEAQQSLIEVFGRETVQIDEGEPGK